MCGIAGFVAGEAGSPDPQALEVLARAMRHRGPDDSGAWAEEAGGLRVGLCATRLAIQDVSANGHQPMVSAGAGSVICFNGELYNVQSLREELARAGHSFRGHSDTEVALAAYEEWGPDCVRRLRGMFALAVWDGRRRRLLLARDRMGIKPLYYSVEDGMIAFGSELRAMMGAGLVPRELSTEGLMSYLTLGGVCEPLTVVKGARALAPGYYALWDGERLEQTEYWSLRASFGSSTDGDAGGDTASRLRECLEDSVRSHLIADVPLGVFLSGGMDSSAMVALAAAVGDRPPQTVSIVLSEREFSEERYIRMVAERFRADHHELRLDEAAFLARLPAALAAMDQPTVDGVNTFVISGVAREEGLTVALSGLGGDELFAGYRTFREVPRMERVARALPARARPLAAVAARAAVRPRHRADKVVRWLGADGTSLDAYALHRELFSTGSCLRLLPGGRPDAIPHPRPVMDDEVNALSHLELTHYMRNVILRDSDVMSMAHSLELRVPLLDHRLVELVAGLPGSAKLSRRHPKPLLYGALADLLPDEIVHRPKRGFTFPFEKWLQGELRKEVQDVLTDPQAGGQVSAALDAQAVRGVWDDFLAGTCHWSRPWALFVAKRWGERHLPS